MYSFIELYSYGDCVPLTAAGKVLGIVGVLLGILVVSLPVPIIQNKVSRPLLLERCIILRN